MRILLLIVLITGTLYGKSQTSTSRTAAIDTAYEKKLLKIIFEHRQYVKLTKYQDSIINAQEQELTLLGLQYESCKVSMDVLEIDNRNKQSLLVKSITEGEQLKSDKKILEKSLKFQKKLKWWTGITGLITGVLTTIYFGHGK